MNDRRPFPVIRRTYSGRIRISPAGCFAIISIPKRLLPRVARRLSNESWRGWIGRSVFPARACVIWGAAPVFTRPGWRNRERVLLASTSGVSLDHARRDAATRGLTIDYRQSDLSRGRSTLRPGSRQPDPWRSLHALPRTAPHAVRPRQSHARAGRGIRLRRFYKPTILGAFRDHEPCLALDGWLLVPQ